MAGTLHVCAAPIGNAADASARLREVLGSVDAIACEDTRVTGLLLEALGVRRDGVRLLAHHEHNERASADGVVALLLAGKDVALVSDAGTPAVSDPGTALVRAAHAAGIVVRVVPGASAVAAAVSVSGAAGMASGFRFVGFLPRSDGEIETLARAHEREVVVALESPRRVRRSLDVVAALQPERVVTVCRELTKVHEQIVRGTAAQALDALEEPVRGEIVLVFDAITDLPDGDDDAPRAARELARAMVRAGLRTKDAARIASDYVGGRTRALYDSLVADDESSP